MVYMVQKAPRVKVYVFFAVGLRLSKENKKYF